MLQMQQQRPQTRTRRRIYSGAIGGGQFADPPASGRQIEVQNGEVLEPQFDEPQVPLRAETQNDIPEILPKQKWMHIA